MGKYIKRENHITIHGWMIEDLNLKGNDLLVYAIIYGFSQDENSCFTGSLQYLADWTNSSIRGIQKNLKMLENKNLIIKNEDLINGTRRCKYYAKKIESIGLSSLRYGTEFIDGIELSSINNINNNINNNIIAQNEHKPIKKQSKTLNEELFNKFWDIYPKKKSKGDAKNWFIKHQPSEELINLMIEKIKKLKETKDWKQDNGQYIPYPTTWLNAEGWEDEINIDKKKDDSFPYELYKQYYGPQGEYYYDEDYKRIFGRVPIDVKH